MAIAGQTTTTRLTLDLWHPNCWAIEATGRAEGGVLAHAIYNSPTTEHDPPGTVQGLFTAFADSEDEITRLLEAIKESDRSGELLKLQERFGRERSAPGDVVTEFFLEYDPDDMVCPTLLKHGFVHSAPVRIQNGRETWQVCFVDARADLEDALERVREDAGAEVTIESITTTENDGGTERDHRLDTLTAQQRQVFEHARDAGYYEWPREASTRELATDLGVSKTTLLEHLRKAEAKLLNP